MYTRIYYINTSAKLLIFSQSKNVCERFLVGASISLTDMSQSHFVGNLCNS